MKIYFATDIHLSSATPSSRLDNYFETMMTKFRYVLSQARDNNGIVILGGDLFHTPTQPDYVKAALANAIKTAGVEVHSIIGNHDLLYYNEDFLYRTSLGLMFDSGVLKRIEDIQLEDGWQVVAHEMFQGLPECTENTVIVSHAYFKPAFNDKLFVSKEEVENSKAFCICMGHDHQTHEMENINNTLVVRPGALSRGSSHSENRTRKVCVAVIDTEERTVTYEVVPHRPFEEIFKDKYLPEEPAAPVTFDEIRDFIETMKGANMKADAYQLLQLLNPPQEVYTRCETYLRDVGLVPIH
jgi:DNA repair exonuclease SbcCD nuclease subunit